MALYEAMDIKIGHVHQGVLENVAAAMAELGWEKKSSIRFGNVVRRGYVKGTHEEQKVEIKLREELNRPGFVGGSRS